MIRFASPNLVIECVHTAAATIVIVSGEVDLGTAARLEEQLRHYEQAGIRVIVDLEHVEFMDAAGLRVLVSASKRSSQEGFAVTPGSPQVQKLFELTGISAVLEVIPRIPDLEQAAA